MNAEHFLNEPVESRKDILNTLDKACWILWHGQRNLSFAAGDFLYARSLRFQAAWDMAAARRAEGTYEGDELKRVANIAHEKAVAQEAVAVTELKRWAAQ